MKKCESCQVEYNSGKFCKKCGQPLVTIESREATPSVVVEEQIKNPTEKNVKLDKTEKKKKKEKKNKKVKKKKRFRPIKFLLLLILFLLIVGLAFSAYYLNQSQIEIDNDYDFDDEAFYFEVNNEAFNGETIEFELDKDAILFFIGENFDEETISGLPLGLEINEIGYDDKSNMILIQIDNKYIHTTLEVQPNIYQDDEMVVVELDKVSLGKWHIPLPFNAVKGLLPLPEEMVTGFEVPEYLIIEPLNYRKGEIEIEIALDLDYFTDHFEEAIDHFDTYSQIFELNNNNVELLIDYYYTSSDWRDSDTKSILREMNTNPRFMELFFAVLESDYREDVIDTLRKDTVFDFPSDDGTIQKEIDMIFDDIESEFN